ncbi:DoxX family protein [Flavitalea antarctica]
MSLSFQKSDTSQWPGTLLFLFRAVFVYFLIQIIPIDPGYYRQLNHGQFDGLHYGDIFNLAHYYPAWFSNAPSFTDWIYYLIFALVTAGIWTFADKGRTKEYNNLYYWFRVILRYRLAMAIIAYGFIKFYPLQAPLPSISNLNTNYGDFTRWKLFGLSLGIVPSYQSFLGGVEIVLGLLLLFRKTASLSAFIIIVFTGNVFMSNLAYEGGEAVYSLFLVSLAITILVYDLQRLNSLLILQKPTAPNLYNPPFFSGWKRYGRPGLKTLFILVFVVLYGFKTGTGYKTDQFQYPAQDGIPGLTGIYNVQEFVINNDTLPYSKSDPVRWSDLVFEKWNTISIRSNRPVIIDSGNVDRISGIDADRTYEFQGTGGRHYYSYTVDSTKNTLTLQNRNSHYRDEKIILTYQKINDSIVSLSGANENNIPVYALLHKQDQKYLLEEVARRGRRKSFKL